MPISDTDSLRTLLARLDVPPADAEEVLRTMPSAQHDPYVWSLLERCHDALVRGEPLPPMPASLPLFPVHLILVSVDAIRQRHQELRIPDDISWETLSFLGRAMTAYRVSHGETGIEITRWDWLRFLGGLYQVGRLEVTPYRLRVHRQAGPLRLDAQRKPPGAEPPGTDNDTPPAPPRSRSTPTAPA